ncbi:proto-oncogene Wnt-3 isoform X2 [Equus quagga]|uniref:proto-oncogene Wnt-3 isoform X2 n=1 Tax=Equus quagga TaxID=89248 RepID=UPI001EE38258|nr:proto-oncogene Wnt-3 isoform X2 [Equus quagga]
MEPHLLGLLLGLLLCGTRVLAGYPIWWSLALGQQYTSLGSQPLLCGSIPGLVPKQLRFCRNYIEIMPSVAEGVKLGIQECQHQFRGRRWNCTTIDDSLAIFGPVLDKATRESAFVHAIASAGVAFAVTRSCAEGTSTICGCDSHHKGPPGEGWKWGGCSEDADFGVLVSREFADARENRPDARSAMNKHNNEAGRTTILDHMHLKCKCHGLSGSCEVKTCWWAQPDFRAIGDFLKDKYDSASEMVVEKHRESRGWVETLRAKYALFKPPTERDLVYYENSPNFCEPNPETGSFGTRDRTCNVTSHGIDGCDLLCCGRGHNTRTEKRKEKCHCIFHWCCYVSCQECVRIYDVHTCKALGTGEVCGWADSPKSSGKRDQERAQPSAPDSTEPGLSHTWHIPWTRPAFLSHLQFLTRLWMVCGF